MYKSQMLGMLVRVKPIEATAQILAAVRNRDGDVRATALDLGVGFRSLYRWIEALGLLTQVEVIREGARDRAAKAL